MVRYDDIKGELKDYEKDLRKHLFEIGSIKVEFWKKRDGLWRTVTDLSIEDAERVSTSLNDSLSDGEHRFYVEEAWNDLERAVFAVPVMTSQIIGSIPDIDTVNRIWSAIASLESDSPYHPKAPKQNLNINMPKGHSIDDILNRLSEEDDIVPKQPIRKIIRKKEQKEENENVEDYIVSLKKEGKTYKQMVAMASKKFGQKISEYRVRKALRSKGLIGK